MLEAAVTDAAGGDWQYRTGLGWFLALPLVLALPVWLSFASPLAIPLALAGGVALIGYGRRILVRSVVDPALPAVDDVGGLGRSALVGTGIVLGLVVAPTALAALALASEASPVASIVTELTAVAVVGVVFVAGAYLTPAALAVSGRSEARASTGGSRRSAMAAVVASRDYVVATLQAILVLFTVGAAALMLLVTVFGLALLPAIVFLALAVVARRYAYAVERALDPSAVESLEERTMSWL